MVLVVKKGASLKSIEEGIKKLKSKKAFNAQKHNGVIQLTDSPLEIQQKHRDEWK